MQFIDTPQIRVFRGDQQISLKVRTNIIRATSFIALQRSIIETNGYWSAFETEKALFTLMWIDFLSTICFASWGSVGTQGGRNEILLCQLRCGLDKIVQCK